MRKVMAVILVFLCFGITAYAFSSVSHNQRHSKLEKGEYSLADEMAVDEDIEAQESTLLNVYAIVSEPVQIFVATPDEVDVEITDEIEEEHTKEDPEEHTNEDSVEGDHNEEVNPAS